MKFRSSSVLFVSILFIALFIFCKPKSVEADIDQVRAEIMGKFVLKKGMEVDKEKLKSLTDEIMKVNGDLALYFEKEEWGKMGDLLEKKRTVLESPEPEYIRISGKTDIATFFRKAKHSALERAAEKKADRVVIEFKIVHIFISDLIEEKKVWVEEEKKYDKVDLSAHEIFEFHIHIKKEETTLQNQTGRGSRGFLHRIHCPWDG